MRTQDDWDTFLADWDTFLNGCWQRTLPQKLGTYPTADREGNRATDRVIVIHPRTKEIAEASCLSWAGWWWSEPYPNLPKPPIWKNKEEE